VTALPPGLRTTNRPFSFRFLTEERSWSDVIVAERDGTRYVAPAILHRVFIGEALGSGAGIPDFANQRPEEQSTKTGEGAQAAPTLHISSPRSSDDT
jgi:hypothetical protein